MNISVIWNGADLSLSIFACFALIAGVPRLGDDLGHALSVRDALAPMCETLRDSIESFWQRDMAKRCCSSRLPSVSTLFCFYKHSKKYWLKICLFAKESEKLLLRKLRKLAELWFSMHCNSQHLVFIEKLNALMCLSDIKTYFNCSGED